MGGAAHALGGPIERDNRIRQRGNQPGLLLSLGFPLDSKTLSFLPVIHITQVHSCRARPKALVPSVDLRGKGSRSMSPLARRPAVGGGRLTFAYCSQDVAV